MNEINMNKLTYEEDGQEIKTSTFLRNRGSCCKTCCRHCPYGHTLREKGLQFEDYHENKRELALEFLKARPTSIGNLAANLLSEGYGEKKMARGLDDYNPRSLKFVLLKGRQIGLMVISGFQVKELFLGTYYRDQGIDIPLVESYYF